MKMTLMPSAFSAAMTSSSLSVSAMRQARRGLVEDDQPRLDRKRLGDLDHLLLGQRQGRDRRVGREIGADPLEQRRHHLAQLRAVDQLQRPGAQRLAADEDVGGDVEIVEQIEFLVDEGDAGAEAGFDGEPVMCRRRRW